MHLLWKINYAEIMHDAVTHKISITTNMNYFGMHGKLLVLLLIVLASLEYSTVVLLLLIVQTVQGEEDAGWTEGCTKHCYQ